MSWLFSQALVEASSVDIYSDGEQSAPLSGANTPQAYCAPDKMTAFSRLSRFGMMFKPLTENLGTELLTLYLAGFHVKTLAPLERGGDYWKPKFNVETHGENYWRSTTPIRFRGEQPNAHY